MSEKAKLDKARPAYINRYLFLALWIAAQAAGWIGFYFGVTGGYLSNDWWNLGLSVGLLVGIPTSVLQKFILRLHFGRSFQGWTRWSVTGWFVGGFSLALLMESGFNGNGQFELVLQILTLMLMPSLAQIYILHRYVNRAWLYLFAHLAGASLFALVLREISNQPSSAFFAFGAYAAITGLSLLWIFGMAGTVDKRKLADENQNERLDDKLSDETPIDEREEKLIGDVMQD